MMKRRNCAVAVIGQSALQAACVLACVVLALGAVSVGQAAPFGPATAMITPSAGRTIARLAKPSAPGSSGASVSVPAKAAGAKPSPKTPGEVLYQHSSFEVRNDPVNWAVMVYKSHHTLAVYYEGRFYKTYHAVFGRSMQPGGKEWAGDRRTPEGLYTIIHKYRNWRWKWFLKLDYPNAVDRIRYTQLRRDGLIPVVHGIPAREGGAIGIHGTDQPLLNEGNVNWTTGCISVDNDAIEELDLLLPVGTIVLIKP